MSGETTAGPALRWGRALVLALVGLGTGTAFHVGTGGPAPGPVLLAVLLGVSTVAVAPFLAARASTRRVVGLLVTWQVLVHTALTLLSGHRGDPASVQSHAAHATHPAPSTADAILPEPAMALGHLAAAAVVGLWLAAGERALWAVLSLAADPVVSLARSWRGAVLGAGWTGPSPSTDLPHPAPVRTADGLTQWFLVRAVPRRGPPVAA